MNWLEKLKKRWNVDSLFQVVIILIVFACTGFTVLFLKPLIRTFFFDGRELSGWNSVVVYMLSPILYNILLLGYSIPFGQFRFFWNFEKRVFLRIASLFGKK